MVYAQARARYRLVEQLDGSILVTGPEGSDRIDEVEKVRFGSAAPVDLTRVMDWRPEVTQPVPDLTAVERRAFSYTLPAGLFREGTGEKLTWSVTATDGAATARRCRPGCAGARRCAPWPARRRPGLRMCRSR